jgi:hypothetical protein
MDANQICQQAHDDFLRHLGNNDHQGVSDVAQTPQFFIDTSLVSHVVVR